MYEFIQGQLIQIQPTYIVILTTSLAYRIYCPNPFVWQDDLNQQVRCYTELIVREDAQLLYGFYSQEERDLFNTLNRVSGIGPKSALSILAVGDHEGLMQAIDQGDSTYLTKFPGVGKKTAQQMILDLSGKLSDFKVDSVKTAPSTSTAVVDEAIQALVGLGYSQREIKRIEKDLNQQHFATTQAALSYAFSQLVHG
ncbi:Holliday junction branch migration protein RuvA [Ignavigranum ruoffiae]|uniref:Holliday junction branch migration protein RuvA n=1 Tax=Ignavigranum ruoffiae TaxID=89093 RepID=UPI0024AE6339|nr:Holliday junction branch migration protein RuvA [Ignavigranum ruoffiae]